MLYYHFCVLCVCVCVYVCLYVCLYVYTCGLNGRCLMILRNSVFDHQDTINLPLALTQSRHKLRILPFPIMTSCSLAEIYRLSEERRNIRTASHCTSLHNNTHNHGCGNIMNIIYATNLHFFLPTSI